MSRALVLLRRTSLILAFALGLVSSCPAEGSTRFDPALRFRAIRTSHFIVYFHQGEDASARRLASVAEETWNALRRSLGSDPPSLTHVVLADQGELANGSATPLPYNTITITAAWPGGWQSIGRTDDWLRLVFTHEFTHIVHLDRSRGWARIARGVFGRTPFAFPNLFLPAWQIEGLATYEESAITGTGRLHAGDFRAIEREAARAGRLEPLDRVNGGLTDWPAGAAPYAYGLGFHAYLADRFGTASLGALAGATAGRIPYTGSRAFKRIYGQPLGALWNEYTATLSAAAEPAAVDDHVTRLTHDGFVALGPRFALPPCAGCPPEIVYSRRTPDAFPTLIALSLDGARSRTLARRYLGATSGVSRTVIAFDQQELRRNVGLYSDLYSLDRLTGRVRRLTSEARLVDPDLSPDGLTIACVREGGGRRDLVLVGLSAPSSAEEPAATAPEIVTLLSEPDTRFETPRWSPDGRSIAVARHRLGSESEVVIVDVQTRAVRPVWSDAATRIVTPAWRADGGAVIAAAGGADDPFNLYEFALDAGRPPRQLTHTSGGATWPDVSADGRTILFVGYTADGSDLFAMPYPDPPDPSAPVRSSPPPERAAPPPDLLLPTETEPYRPWRTLKPTSWTPIVDDSGSQVRIGIAAGGFDVLGYHAYAGSATWLVDGPDGATLPGRATPDIDVQYVYDRWRPALFATASASTSFFAEPATDEAGAPSQITARRHEGQLGVFLPFRHVRMAHLALGAVLRSVDHYAFSDGAASVRRTSLRAGWSTSTAHTYGYSISPEGGFSIGASGEWTRRALGSSGDATTYTSDARAYLPGLGRHHVVAIRGGAGSSAGTAVMRRAFLLGGARSNPDTLDFGGEALSLLRGFPADSFAGARVAVLNADYRWPLARPQRGHGTWPLFLHTIHAAIFADAGHAWTRRFRASDIKAAAGAELSADAVAGYFLPLTATVGIGWGRDGADRASTSRVIYLRLGRAF